ncbi:carbohydrate ABC transporter substrate-binding protein, CUT1 family (TC 3.A.1.1.-) [Streptomyces sp. WMMB 714]|uniref:ABC transporter substrate-binding protein n=1 Tax=Streptomyces sp. WMMB 714 TaxID=1286822 RepID=UPI0008239F90|nr:ABC transporter substrate-binding protein [Streptomyces sp. WMMB 714]SCK17359.1 carbohydrate ABC transporter substrate-binding protein, CUT1 family (TC 3.A.1.1.-) [Streptomyces sp. WMMB 714]
MRAIERRLLPCTAVTAALTLVGGCGLSAKSDEGGADPKERGPITFVSGKNTSGTVEKLIDHWNDKHPDEKVTFVGLPEDGDEQRAKMARNAKLKADTYTVLTLDVVWTAEFAANRWIDEIPENSFPFDKTLGAVNGTVEYRGKLFGMPYASDGAMLYYRKDLLKKADIEPPRTWDELRGTCGKILPEQKEMSCYGGQFDKYEGLTVNFSEAVNSAGGQVTDARGNPHLDTPEAKRGLDNLVEGFRDGTMPKKGISYMEENGRQDFEKGRLLFYRNWPYQYGVSNTKAKGNKVAGKFGVAPIPGEKGTGASSLGGHNLALSSSARNKATALDFMRYMTSEEGARLRLAKATQAPVFEKVYDDPKLAEDFPWLPVLKKSIVGAEQRPRVVRYGDASKVIQREVHAALTGKKSSAAALEALQKELKALKP